MCRLAVQFVKCDKDRLEEHYNRLTVEGGGHGIGVGWFGGCIKGVDLSEEECAEATLEAIENGLGPVLFHTRIATSGAVDDYYCHPFPVGENGWLIHNGCWDHEQARWSLLASGADVDEVVCANDSQTAALLVEQFGEKALYLIDTGVFVVQQDRVVNVYVLSGDFAGWKDEDGNWWYASSPPRWAIDPQKFERGSVAELRVNGPVFKFGKMSEYPPFILKGVCGKQYTYAEPTKRGKKKKKNRWQSNDYDLADDYYQHNSDEPIAIFPVDDDYSEKGKIADIALDKAIEGKELSPIEKQALWDIYEMTEEDFCFVSKTQEDDE